MKKVVFFDIDGTLWDSSMVIPHSTVEAIHKLKENGVYTFLSSGRTLAYISDPKLWALEFDGILAGCGTYVSFGEKEFVYKTISPKDIKRTLDVLKKYDMPVALEGKKYYYLEADDFAGIPFLLSFKRDVGENLVGIAENDMKWEVSKFAAFVKNDNFIKAVEELSDLYDFNIHGKIMVEGVPKGFSKASGIQAICEKIGIAHEDTYAFGDSANDVKMLEYVAHGIAMGNGMQEAKDAADYVTDGIYEDGIYNACRYFSLI